MDAAPERVLIWGAGQHGRVVAEIARAAGHTVVGFVDSDPVKIGRIVDATGAFGVLGEEELLLRIRVGRALPDGAEAVIPAVGHNRTRFMQMQELRELLARAVVHPTAYVSPSADVRAGSVVGPMAVVNAGARVGSCVIVNTGAEVGHDSIVADGAHISGGVILAGATRVGVCSFVGANATLIPGVCLGDDVIVGAGAVVIHDVPNGITVVGVPARPLEHRHHDEPDLSLAAAPLRA